MIGIFENLIVVQRVIPGIIFPGMERLVGNPRA